MFSLIECMKPNLYAVKNMPYRYFNESLVLYPRFLRFKANRLIWDFPVSPWSLTPLTSLDYSCTASVYCTPTTRILLLDLLWWYTTRHVGSFFLLWQDHPHQKDSLWSSIPNYSISLNPASQLGWKTYLHWVNHVWIGMGGFEPPTTVSDTCSTNWATFLTHFSYNDVTG